jgi:hypothetical protein
VLLRPGHCEEGRIVHLTHTSLFDEGLCGEPVTLDGEPDLAVVCPECLEIALAAGVDVSAWVADIELSVTLPLAA